MLSLSLLMCFIVNVIVVGKTFPPTDPFILFQVSSNRIFESKYA